MTNDQWRISRLGVEFSFQGDWVIWLWWWKRRGRPKFISCGFSGTGEFGDARFGSLREVGAAWRDFEDASRTKSR